MIPDLQNKISAAVEKFSTSLANTPPELYEPIRYMLSLGGKRIRPLFVLTACKLYKEETEKALSSALAVELFHNFTLVHDDIMDNAPIRRGQPTVHQKWNNNVAILSGDVMMVKAIQLISDSKLEPQILINVLSTFNEMAIGVCEGQQLDLNYEQSYKISIPQYLKMIELKTAVLLAASLKIGGLIGGASDEDAKHLYEFGKNIGIAFQLQDDLLDVYGEEGKFGKIKGGDIIANKKTFLLIKAREMAMTSPLLSEELEQWIGIKTTNDRDSNEKIEAVTRIYDFVNIKKVTEGEILFFHQKAITSLEKVNADSDKKNNLLNLTEKLLSRES